MMTVGLWLANQFFVNPNQLEVMQMYENGIKYQNIQNIIYIIYNSEYESDNSQNRRVARTRQSVPFNQ